MIRFLNRPFLALAAALSVIFIFILFSSYIKLLKSLSPSDFEVTEIGDYLFFESNSSSNVVDESQISKPPLAQLPNLLHFTTTPITLG